MTINSKYFNQAEHPLCPQCPYTLGQVAFADNPCPVCKLDDYSMYEMFVKGNRGFGSPITTEKGVAKNG